MFIFRCSMAANKIEIDLYRPTAFVEAYFHWTSSHFYSPPSSNRPVGCSTGPTSDWRSNAKFDQKNRRIRIRIHDTCNQIDFRWIRSRKHFNFRWRDNIFFIIIFLLRKNQYSFVHRFDYGNRFAKYINWMRLDANSSNE